MTEEHEHLERRTPSTESDVVCQTNWEKEDGSPVISTVLTDAEAKDRQYTETAPLADSIDPRALYSIYGVNGGLAARPVNVHLARYHAEIHRDGHGGLQ